MKCSGCGTKIEQVDHGWVDELGETTCDRAYEECEPCEDGDPHPHWVGMPFWEEMTLEEAE